MLLNLLHITLVLHLLLSSTGVTVFEHLCQVQGRTASVFVRAKGCCQQQEATKTACHAKRCCQKKQQPAKGIFKKSCCEDRSQYLQSGVNGTAFKALMLPIFKLQPLFMGAFTSLEWACVVPFLSKILRFYLYKPPPLVSNITVLVQAFRC